MWRCSVVIELTASGGEPLGRRLVAGEWVPRLDAPAVERDCEFWAVAAQPRREEAVEDHRQMLRDLATQRDLEAGASRRVHRVARSPAPGPAAPTGRRCRIAQRAAPAAAAGTRAV